MRVAGPAADTPSRSIARATALALALSLLHTHLRARRHHGHPVRAVMTGLTDATTMDERTGAVRSVQRADLDIETSALDEIWTPMHLERLARTYWRFLTRVTLGLIRVVYSEQERAVVLLARPLRLLTFKAPEYEIDASHGLVRWRIARGLLVARHSHDGTGYLQIEVRRSESPNPEHERLHVEVAVANFYPSIASRISLRLYNATQSRIHVIVTKAFLRSLARLDLAESRVGQLAYEGPR
jgi:hypothetical protein